MRLPQIPYMGLVGLVTIFSAGAHVPVAWAEVANTTGPPMLSHIAISVYRSLGAGASKIIQSEGVVLLLALLVLAVLVAGSAALDRVRDRRVDAVALLQARIANAWLHDRRACG